MPKQKSHKGLLKRIKITKTGKVRFRAPNSRHLKSNKSGQTVQSYRKNRYARNGMIGRLELMLGRPLKSQEQHMAEIEAMEAMEPRAPKPETRGAKAKAEAKVAAATVDGQNKSGSRKPAAKAPAKSAAKAPAKD